MLNNYWKSKSSKIRNRLSLLGLVLCASALVVGYGLVGSARAQVAVSTDHAAQPARQAARAVTIKLVQFKVVKGPDGKERLVGAERVAPGDVIEYRATYKNISPAPVRGLTATLPIPTALTYIARTTRPGGAKFAVSPQAKSADFAVEPLMRRQPDGAMQPVPYSTYRMIHWTVESLAPGATFAVSARARVEVAAASTGGGRSL